MGHALCPHEHTPACSLRLPAFFFLDAAIGWAQWGACSELGAQDEQHSISHSDLSRTRVDDAQDMPGAGQGGTAEDHGGRARERGYCSLWGVVRYRCEHFNPSVESARAIPPSACLSQVLDAIATLHYRRGGASVRVCRARRLSFQSNRGACIHHASDVYYPRSALATSSPYCNATDLLSVIGKPSRAREVIRVAR